jgi:L-threonylcarbamoyladenylate synthase
MKFFEINPHAPSDEALTAAVEALREDKIICYPTETLYGFGTNALSERACDRLNQIKERKPGQPFLMLILRSWAEDWIMEAMSAKPLLERFWEGGLTVVATPPSRSHIPKWLLASDGGIAIRSASMELNIRMLEMCGFPITSTSVNQKNSPPLKKLDSGDTWLAEVCDVALDAGIIDCGLPSTIADIRKFPSELRILRRGVISIEEIATEFPKTRIVIV